VGRRGSPDAPRQVAAVVRRRSTAARQDPANYSKANMPFLLAGGGGGLRPGRWLRYANRSHNELLVALLHLFGDARASFGTAQYSTGALTNLT